MRPQEIISIKRDGGKLSADHINSFIDGVCDGSWADYQITALVMAMFVRGLDVDEQEALTRAMLYSGEVLDFSDIDAPKADKHSTGGVGDKTSLIIAPLVATCGVAVPMISGRGLGHTGGTLDKLESIPGYNVKLSTAQFRSILEKCGFAMAGQTAEIVPADKKLYALRDATATVSCIPLIVASIMSKKMAEGLDALVLDVKTGSGAFMQSREDSINLAKALVTTGTDFGVKTEAVVSDMNQPLGKYVGHSLEVYECIQILRGEIDDAVRPTWQLSHELSARMLVVAGVSETIDAARMTAYAKLSSGEALEKFRQNVELQGGDPKICDDPKTLLTDGLVVSEVKARKAGFVSAIDTLCIGNSVVSIGGGRTKADDRVDPTVGFASEIKIGDEIREGDILGVLYSRSEAQFNTVGDKLRNCYVVADERPQTNELIHTIITSETTN
jgi:pyrimidine-nucleoside phosphorylase